MEELKSIYEKELKELEIIAQIAENELKNAPQGTLRISKSNNREQYYWRRNPKDDRGKYIKKSEEALKKDLAQKDYA